MKREHLIKMYNLISTDIERFFQRYTSYIHHHSAFAMYLSSIFVDFQSNKIRKMNSYNSILFKINKNKVRLKSKDCVIKYSNFLNFEEGEDAYKDLMNMLFSMVFPIFEKNNIAIKVCFHNQIVLEIETSKPYKYFVFRKNNKVDKNILEVIDSIKSFEVNEMYKEIAVALRNEHSSQSGDTSNDDQKSKEEMRLIRFANMANIIRKFVSYLEKEVRSSWLYCFNVINNIINERNFSNIKNAISVKDTRKVLFFLRSFINEMPNHINTILKELAGMLTENKIKSYKIDGLELEIMKTLSSNFYLQKGLYNMYLFFRDLMHSETDINIMRKMIRKYNPSIEIYVNDSLIYKQYAQDHFIVYEKLIKFFYKKVKNRMKVLNLSKVDIKKYDLSDHMTSLMKNSIRFQNKKFNISKGDRNKHMNFFIKYTLVSERIANFILDKMKKNGNK